MTIPVEAVIAVEKVRDYLLKPQAESDKSKYLSLAGYSRERYEELITDLRSQVLPAEGEFQERREQGDLYIVRSRIKGPNGRELAVRTIWLRKWTNEWNFVTLFPDRRAEQ